MLLASAQRESYSIRREWCAEKNVWNSAPVCGTAMRVIAIFSRPCAADALTAQVSVFSYDFKELERFPTLATSSSEDQLNENITICLTRSSTAAAVSAGQRIQEPGDVGFRVVEMRGNPHAQGP
jgi:hypothetical protein